MQNNMGNMHHYNIREKSRENEPFVTSAFYKAMGLFNLKKRLVISLVKRL